MGLDSAVGWMQPNRPSASQTRSRLRSTVVSHLEAKARGDGVVLFIDLDGFKLVNDSYGHAAGDQLLVVAASRIGGCLGANDVLARQGGDEFLALVLDDAVSTAQTILQVLAPPFVVDGKETFVSASIGIVEALGDLSPEQAAQRADIGMYAAKEAGKAQPKPSSSRCSMELSTGSSWRPTSEERSSAASSRSTTSPRSDSRVTAPRVSRLWCVGNPPRAASSGPTPSFLLRKRAA